MDQILSKNIIEKMENKLIRMNHPKTYLIMLIININKILLLNNHVKGNNFELNNFLKRIT